MAVVGPCWLWGGCWGAHCPEKGTGVWVRDPSSQLPALPAALWNFPRTHEHHLPLQIGETVHILQASEGKGGPGCTPTPAG